MRSPLLRIAGPTLALLGLAAPAHALKVTNLDTVTHRVAFASAGTTEVRTIEPNVTTEWSGRPDGKLSLLSSAHPNAGGPVEGTGLLSRMIGNGRDQEIPVYGMDEYTIWPEGKLLLQSRKMDMNRF